MIKLVATDIDGTLFQSGEREVSEAVFVQIDRLLKKGILFAAASGRQYSNLKNLFAPKAEEMTFLCENGAVLYQKDQILKKRPMPRSRAEVLAKQILANDDMEVLISGANTSYLMPKHDDYIYHIQYFLGNRVEIVRSLDEIKEDMIKVSAYCRSGAAKYDKPFGDPWRGEFSVAVAGEKWLDFMLSDKGTGMRDLCSVLGISLEDVIAIGDNYNDLPMLTEVGHPWIMKNSTLDQAGFAQSHGFLRAESVEEILKEL